MKREEYLATIRTHLGSAYNLPGDKIDSMMPRFLRMLSMHLLNLEALSKQNDLEALGKAGHALKGALLNLGLPNLARQALLIEQQCKVADRQVDCNHVIRILKNEIELFTCKP